MDQEGSEAYAHKIDFPEHTLQSNHPVKKSAADQDGPA